MSKLRIPAIALLALAGLVLAWLSVSAWQGRGTAGKTWDSIYRGHGLIVPAGPHSWIAPYNEGTSLLMSEDYSRAVPPLERALARVPTVETSGSRAGSDECRVRINLSLAYEGEALKLGADGKHDEGLARMNLAAETSKPCTTDGQGGDGSTADEDRIHQRQRDAAGAVEGEPTDQPTTDGETEEKIPDSTVTPTPKLDDKQDELEDNQRHAEDELRQREQRKGEGFGSGEAW
ncbi:hypothetical protein [Bowdeniella massiliensis]|uniref:hypothetical protein n=1 Tax=Bowdeniella massiliensis TaxID=2932264 RepID=UPI002028E20D|nr:hypothetical protein [Bowdeniella massiliensis]